MNPKSEGFIDKLLKFIKELDFLRDYIPPINSAGYPFIILFFCVSLFISILIYNKLLNLPKKKGVLCVVGLVKN